jgi:hypothetical protein
VDASVGDAAEGDLAASVDAGAADAEEAVAGEGQRPCKPGEMPLELTKQLVQLLTIRLYQSLRCWKPKELTGVLLLRLTGPT